MYRRKFKVTLTVEVPISDSYEMNEDGVSLLIESYLSGLNPDIFDIDKEPLEDVHKDWQGEELEPINDSEDITKFSEPVGYIAPDGKFYGGQVGYDPLMHILYAKEVWEAYKNKIGDDVVRKYGHSSGGIDYDLERWGFIKVRQFEIRYYVPYYKTVEPILWTPAQCATVMRYIKMIENVHGIEVQFKTVCGDCTHVNSRKFAKMTDADIINCFRS